jgi:hypothetical protein
LERAWGVDAEELELVADVRMPRPASRAMTAGIERPDYDPVTGLPSRDSGADLSDQAGHLVPYDLRDVNALIHVALVDVEVRPADAAVCNKQSHLARAGAADLGLAQLYRLASLIVCSFHLSYPFFSNSRNVPAVCRALPATL